MLFNIIKAINTAVNLLIVARAQSSVYVTIFFPSQVWFVLELRESLLKSVKIMLKRLLNQ